MLKYNCSTAAFQNVIDVLAWDRIQMAAYFFFFWSPLYYGMNNESVACFPRWVFQRVGQPLMHAETSPAVVEVVP